MNYWKFLYKVFGGKYTEIIDPPILDEVVAKTNECKLTVCLALYGDMYWKNKDCTHVFCKCDHCIKNPTCLKCRLFMNTGAYL